MAQSAHSRSISKSASYDVIIVGAGAAGLACAHEVAKTSAHYLVLDARDRVGGRIASVHPAGSPVALELGAEFIHGRPDGRFLGTHRESLGTS